MDTRIVPGVHLDLSPAINVGSYTVQRRRLNKDTACTLTEEFQAKILYIISGKGKVTKFKGFRAVYLPPGEKHTIKNTGSKPLDFIIITRKNTEEEKFNCSIDEPSLLLRHNIGGKLAFLDGGIVIKNTLHPELSPEQLPIVIYDHLLESNQKTEWVRSSERTHHFIFKGKGEIKFSKNKKFNLNPNECFTTHPQEEWRIKNTSDQPLNYLTIAETLPY